MSEILNNNKETSVYDGSTPLKSVMQELFVSNLLQGMSQAEAYRQAGYKSKTPDSQANQIMRNNKVLARVAYKRGLLAKKLEITEERVLAEFARCAFVDPAAAFGDDGEVLSIRDMPEDTRRALSGMDVEEEFEGRGESRKQTGYIKKLRFWNKHDNLESLAKHLGLFAKDHESTLKGLLLTRELTADELRSLLTEKPIDAKDAIAG